MGKLTKQDLFDHLEKYKNAVFIVGPNAQTIEQKYTLQEFEENYTNKNLRRNTKDFWKFYRDKMITEVKKEDAYEVLKELDEKGYIKRVYSQNTSPALQSCIASKVEYLHGRHDLYKCTKCKVFYTEEYAKDFEEPTCELCGKPIRPTVLFPGENYDDDLYHQLKEDLVETNTLFLVGFDFLEDAIAALVFQFIDNKNMKNRLGDPDQKSMIVCVGGDGDRDLDKEAIFEFLVYGDVNASMKRLME